MQETTISQETLPSLRGTDQATTLIPTRKLFLFVGEEEIVNYEEITAVKDPRFLLPAVQMARVFQGAINPQNLSFDFAKALELATKDPNMAVVGTINQTIQQHNAVVSAMIGKIVELLKEAVGVVLGTTQLSQLQSAITDAFTSLAPQQGDAWIFWQKEEAHKTTYTYNILFAIQNEMTGSLLLGLPVGMVITVNVEKERVLFITTKDIEDYNVTVQAIKVARPLDSSLLNGFQLPSSPGYQSEKAVQLTRGRQYILTLTARPTSINVTDRAQIMNWSGRPGDGFYVDIIGLTETNPPRIVIQARETNTYPERLNLGDIRYVTLAGTPESRHITDLEPVQTSGADLLSSAPGQNSVQVTNITQIEVSSRTTRQVVLTAQSGEYEFTTSVEHFSLLNAVPQNGGPQHQDTYRIRYNVGTQTRIADPTEYIGHVTAPQDFYRFSREQ